MCTDQQQMAVRAMADAINNLGLIGSGEKVQKVASNGVTALYKALAEYQYTHGLQCIWSDEFMIELMKKYGVRKGWEHTPWAKKVEVPA